MDPTGVSISSVTKVLTTISGLMMIILFIIIMSGSVFYSPLTTSHGMCPRPKL